MKINKGIKFNFKKEDFDIKKISLITFEFLVNNLGFVFVIFFIGVVLLSSTLIYKYIYGSVWSEDEKNAYIQEIKKDNINFKANVFNDVINEIEKRKIKYNANGKIEINDIFGIK